MDGLTIVEEEEELTAYVTIDGVVHGCAWMHYGNDWAEIIVMCTGRVAPMGTRTAKNAEVITCIACQVRT